MSLYSRYEALLGIPYDEGDKDCYGLMRRYFLKNYELELRNYARPIDFAHAGLNLIADNFKAEGFVVVEASLDRLQIGDGLLMALKCDIPNHVGAFVGNGYMLHHLFGTTSSAEPFIGPWRRRVLNVVRHPLVTEKNLQNEVKVDLMSLLSPHVKARFNIPA